MRMTEYLRIFRRRMVAIGLAVVLTAVAAYVFSKLQEPLYRSEASYLVVPNRNDNGLSIVLTNNMNSYKQLALARPQIEKLNAQLQLDRSPEWLLEHISIQANADDRKMIVQVDYPDIDMAPRLANAYYSCHAPKTLPPADPHQRGSWCISGADNRHSTGLCARSTRRHAQIC